MVIPSRQLAIRLATIAAVVALVTSAYVAAERTFYFWDQASYHDATVRTAQALRAMRTPADAARFAASVAASTGADYSLLHTLAVAPVLLLFGESRLTYIVALGCVYLAAFVAVVGLLAATLVPGRRNAAFAAGALALLALPPAWLPTLQGYPDAGAAALYGSAVLLYLNALRPLRWRTIAGIAVLLALAMVFRRHFIYAASAFLIAILVDAALVALLRRDPVEARQAVREAVTLGVAVLLVLAVLAWPFLAHSLRTEFARYASWEQSPIANWRWYRDAFGAPIFLLGPLGLAVGLAARVIAVRPGRFLLVLCLVSTAQWLLVVRQLGTQYALHFTPWVALGVFAAGWTVWRRGSRLLRPALLGALGLYLVVNVTTALVPSEAFVPVLRDVGAAGREYLLFARATPPVTRSDREAILALLAELRRIAAPDDPIYVAASSWWLNGDLLWHADRDHGGGTLSILRYTPFADSTSSYPLETLLPARFVVLPSAFQGHLAAGEQDVVAVVGTIFADAWPFARDFTILPARFPLQDGSTVALARRDRPTSLATALATLDAMDVYLGGRPGAQASWLGLNATPGCRIRQRSRGRVRIHCDRANEPRVFLRLDPPPRTGKLAGRIDVGDPSCAAVTLVLAAVDLDGTTLASTPTLRPGPGEHEFRFALPSGHDRSRLLLTLDAPPVRNDVATCSIVIDDMVVRPH